MWWRAVTAVDMSVQSQTPQALGRGMLQYGPVLPPSSQHEGSLSGPMSVDLYTPGFLWDIIHQGLVSVCGCAAWFRHVLLSILECPEWALACLSTLNHSCRSCICGKLKIVSKTHSTEAASDFHMVDLVE